MLANALASRGYCLYFANDRDVICVRKLQFLDHSLLPLVAAKLLVHEPSHFYCRTKLRTGRIPPADVVKEMRQVAGGSCKIELMTEFDCLIVSGPAQELLHFVEIYTKAGA